MRPAWRFLLFATFAFTSIMLGGMAPAWAQSLPTITSHSQTEFSVYRGDKLAVEVQAAGQDIEVKWLQVNSTFCRTLACEIDTKDWSLGVHRFTFVVFNKEGSLSLRFQVRVLEAPIGYVPGTVHPPMLNDAEGIEEVSREDLTVRTMTGRGYSYHRKKLQVVGPLPRALEWSEKLRTQAGSTLLFGRDDGEAHILAPSSSVYLAKAGSGRRAVVLTKGTLRSRSLGREDPRWSVLVDKWLQIDTDAEGDVLVTRETPKGGGDSDTAAEERVTVTVLRGHARVFIYKEGETKGDAAGTAVTVPQGLALTLRRSDTEPGRPALPVMPRTGALVRLTSPQYLPGGVAKAIGEGQMLLGDKRPKSFEEALALAVEANTHRDFFVAIEALQPFADAARESYAASYALGEAYFGVFLFEPAAECLHMAAELKEEAPEPHFLLGLMALGKRDWKAAESELETAEDLGYQDLQVLYYYLGVAQYNGKNRVAAKSTFTYSLWESGSADITGSAQSFSRQITDTSWFDVRFAGGVIFDTNVLRSDSLDPSTLAGGITTKKSAGYDGRFGFSLWPARSDGFKFELAFDAQKVGYFNSSLKSLAMIDQKLALNASLGFGGGDGPKTLTLDADGFARTISLGDQRALDEIGTVLAVGSPATLGLKLSIESTIALDPLPARDDILDPVRWEVVPAGDRSCHLLYYTLGLTPVDGEHLRFGAHVRSGGAVYRSALHEDETFKDLGLGADLGYAVSLRSHLDLDATQTTRKFDKADDQRKDTTLGLGLGWSWYYTTALSHQLEAGLENQRSTRDVNSYKRQLYSYRLNLAF